MSYDALQMKGSVSKKKADDTGVYGQFGLMMMSGAALGIF